MIIKQWSLREISGLPKVTQQVGSWCLDLNPGFFDFRAFFSIPHSLKFWTRGSVGDKRQKT